MNDSLQNIVKKLAKDLEDLHSAMSVAECQWGREYREAVKVGNAAIVQRLNRELADRLHHEITQRGC